MQILSKNVWFCSQQCDCWWPNTVNSLAHGRPGCHFKTAIFNLVVLIGIFISSKDNARRWMPRDLTDDKSTSVQVMAWCRQATSHYLSQCWPRFLSLYGVTRPQWVKCWAICRQGDDQDQSLVYTGLALQGPDKMAAIPQTTFSNAFSCMKIYKFQLRFHWRLFPRVQLTIFQHWFR